MDYSQKPFPVGGHRKMVRIIEDDPTAGLRNIWPCK
jgi:hypothetical protein